MAVYTHVSEDAVATLIRAYDIGDFVSMRGVEQGVENTNYILTTTRGRYVLTLFEKRTDERDLPFFMASMAHMSARAVPAPEPVATRDGEIIRRISERAAAITTFLPGAQRMTPSPADCRLMGATNARLHLAASDFKLQRPNSLALDGWRSLAVKTAPRADECASGLCALIADEIDFQTRKQPKDAPRGLIHADLFPDNVFFADGKISGVIDFYFACTDAYAYDLAITLNAWSYSKSGWNVANAEALIEGYQSVRRITADERTALGVYLRGAALRILLTRLFDFLNRVDGAIVAIKDPIEYRDLLLLHRSGAANSLFG